MYELLYLYMELAKLKETIKNLYESESDESSGSEESTGSYQLPSYNYDHITREKIKQVRQQRRTYRHAFRKFKDKFNTVPTKFKTTVDTFIFEADNSDNDADQAPVNYETKKRLFIKHDRDSTETLKRSKIYDIDKLLQDKSLDKDTRSSYQLEKGIIQISPLLNTLRRGVSKQLNDYCSVNADFLLEKHYLDPKFFKIDRSEDDGERLLSADTVIKVEQEKRKKAKHKSFMSRLFGFKKEFLDFHKKKSELLRRNALSSRIIYNNWIKRAQERFEAVEKERLNAIKSQKFDVYKDLLQKAKNKRIIEILEETDHFLQEIGIKVLHSKGQVNPAPVDAIIYVNSEYDINKSSLLNENYNTMYYNFTHSSNEEVKEQPSMLVGGKLKSYQMTGLKWMISLYNNKLNGILADEMGLGKTIQTISLICYLIEHKANFGPFLIIAPLSTLPNWKIEFEKWAPSVKKIIYKGNFQQRKEIARYLKNNRFNVCLTTYEFVMRDKNYLSKFHWQYIVVDEGHKMKNSKSKFAYTLGSQYNSEHRLLLTGTPLQNNLTELWALLNFLLPKVFSAADDFERWFKLPMKRVGTDKEIELNEEEKLLIAHRFHQVLRPFLLRRIKREVEKELPNKLEFVIKVELSSWQKLVYNQISSKSTFTMMSSSSKLTSTMMSNIIMQLRKVCNHPYLFVDDYDVSDELIRVSGKFELLDRMIPKLIKSGHRMLVFTQMTSVLNLLELYLDFKEIKFLRLDGNTKHEERAERMLQFNAPDCDIPIFILSTKAGGLGLNLQTADTVILFDSDWNPAVDEQAQDRAHRIGTVREVRVFRLITQGTIEEQILMKASYKKGLDEMVIQAGLYNNKATDVERRQKLEEIIKKQNLDQEDKDEIPNDEDINRIISRSDEEFETFQLMDEERYSVEKNVYGNFNKNINYRLIAYEELPRWIRNLNEEKRRSEVLVKRRKPRIRDLSRLRDDDSQDESPPTPRLKKIKDRLDFREEKDSKEEKDGIEEILIDSDD